MKTASVAEMTKNFAEYLSAIRSSPVVVTRAGKPVAVLLAVDREEDVQRLVLAQSRRLREILAQGHREIREGRGIPHDEFWRDVMPQGSSRPKTPGKQKHRRSQRKAE